MRLLWSLALLALTGAAQAQQVTIYRCTDASGALTVQNDVPCPKGSKQDKRVIGSAPTTSTPPAFVTPIGAAPAPPPNAAPKSPPATPMPASTAPAAPPASTAQRDDSAVSDRLPPPTLFECRTFDNDRYLSDKGDQPERCAPLQTYGVNGGPSAGAACQMVTDQCQRVADGALCESWRQRLRQAESQLRFGPADQRAGAQADVERMGRIVRESTCGQ
ncbi:DUF4124 domain-containing protein [Lysobacter sp. Root983]|uniref:DUF4124 domain-containing protein n=1 Tax=Lysobacter sp. Root983 TaxID=1736613 RepID=UPI000710F928|nr:DUF4124 domain-containing protein [Lysobacter sp. Root983]KRD77015.1 hypothetical protein ASE43_07465 [Lysobacter sp. Root983]